jgi:hypothetical protein
MESNRTIVSILHGQKPRRVKMSIVALQLSFVRDTGRYLVGSYAGAEYWFDKRQTPEWEVDGGALKLATDQKAWERRLKTAKIPPERVETRLRNCMCCSTPFEAEKHLRVCDPCKKTDSWKMGGTVFA